MALRDATATPLYQRIASKALHLQQLGLSPSVIARRLGVTGKTAIKAIAWMAEARPSRQDGRETAP